MNLVEQLVCLAVMATVVGVGVAATVGSGHVVRARATVACVSYAGKLKAELAEIDAQ